MKTFVKICGVTTLDDALACVDAGADAIGFNFWPESKRHVAVGTAATIAKRLPPNLRTFGVFVNPAADEIDRAFASGAIDLVQLHGDESPEFCQRFAGRYVKALRLRDPASLAQLVAYPCDLVLVDADTAGYGGSGQRADVTLAAEAARSRRVILAGGLTPENVTEAIRQVRPYGVDVAGGVEREPGVKDWIKVAAFVSAAKRAEQP
ncbi:MAG: Phosphoribosylanthranilate isomerase [Myxococcales bacterium]|nr:Phosphoribosylanthranilate isomerase [Myxococcales bacterium]